MTTLTNSRFTPSVGQWQLGRIDGYPCSGDISTLFGVQDDLHPGGHSGLDIAANAGDAIHAPCDATVSDVFALPLKGNQWDAYKTLFGNYVILDLGDCYMSFCHMQDAPVVREGNIVKTGDILGYVGNTGYSFGPHCHWSVGKHDNRYMNFPPDSGPKGVLLDALDYCTGNAPSGSNSQGTGSATPDTQSVPQEVTNANKDFITSQLNSINAAVAQVRNNL